MRKLRKFIYKLNKIVSNDSTERIQGKGMPIRKYPGQYGDLIVHYKVQNPTYLTENQKEQLKKVLSEVNMWA